MPLLDKRPVDFDSDSLDDILGEIAAPAPAAPIDDLDDILSEVAGPAPTVPTDDFDDILSEIAGPAVEAPADDFDDILSEIAGPVPEVPAADLDDILSEIAGPAPGEEATAAKPKGGRKHGAKAAPAPEQDELGEMLDALAPVTEEMPAADASAPDKQGLAGKSQGLVGAILRPFQGTRKISRKAYFGLIGLAVLSGLTAIAEAGFILLAPAPAPPPNAGPAPVAMVTLIPIDYSKVDLHRYRDKTRSLSEGGRDMLRNPAIKNAILELNNGEELYDELRGLARGNAAADRVEIRNDRLTIVSCLAPVCGDKSFRLVYDLQRESALVCMTEKYLNDTYISYSYGPQGYRERPSCNGGPAAGSVGGVNPPPAQPIQSSPISS